MKNKIKNTCGSFITIIIDDVSTTLPAGGSIIVDGGQLDEMIMALVNKGLLTVIPESIPVVIEEIVVKKEKVKLNSQE